MIGDGCLTVFQGSQELVFQQAQKTLKPNGRLILRLFIAPDSREDIRCVMNCFLETVHLFFLMLFLTRDIPAEEYQGNKIFCIQKFCNIISSKR